MFAGYKVPHPLEHKFILRVQTVQGVHPHHAIMEAISDLVSELSFLAERFRVSYIYRHKTFRRLKYFGRFNQTPF